MGTSRARGVTWCAVLALASGGCAVRLIAPHDPVLEQGVTNVSSEVSAFLSAMEADTGTSDAAYRPNIGFYARTAGELRTLRLRAEVTPKSELVVDSLDLIAANVERLRVLHSKAGEGGLSPPTIASMKTALEVQFRAMFKLLAEMRRDR